MIRNLVGIVLITFLIFSCKSIVPRNGNYIRGFYHQYTKLDFNQIAYTNDTSWHKQINPLADLILKNPTWHVRIKTFLADSSHLPFQKRLDAIVCGKIRYYLLERGVNNRNLSSTAYNNLDDPTRLLYQGTNRKKFKSKKFKRNTFEWEITRIEEL